MSRSDGEWRAVTTPVECKDGTVRTVTVQVRVTVGPNPDLPADFVAATKDGCRSLPYAKKLFRLAAPAYEWRRTPGRRVRGAGGAQRTARDAFIVECLVLANGGYPATRPRNRGQRLPITAPQPQDSLAAAMSEVFNERIDVISRAWSRRRHFIRHRARR